VPAVAPERDERPECAFRPEIALARAHRAQTHHLTVEFAALHGEKQWRRAGIAAHDRHVQAEHLLGNHGEDQVARGRIIGAQHRPRGFEVGNGPGRVIGVDEHEIGVVRIGR